MNVGASPSPRTRLEARLCRGLLALKVRDHRGAGEEFSALMKDQPKEAPISLRARFYWSASRAVDSEFRRRHDMDANAVKSSKLYLCGLGIFPPYTASLAAKAKAAPAKGRRKKK